MKKHDLPCHVKSLIPHSGAMIFVDTLMEISENSATCSYKVKDNIFTDGKTVSPLLFVELFAQSAAAFSSYTSDCSIPLSGFLIGVDNLIVSEPLLLNDDVKIKISRTESLGPIAFFHCSAEKKSSSAASGIIKVWSGEVPVNVSAPDSVFSCGPVKDDLIRYIRNIKTSNNSIEVEICFENDFCAFKGHFDGMPVVPAIALIYSAVYAAEKSLGKKFFAGKISSAKFSRRVSPGETAVFEISHNGDNLIRMKTAVSVNSEKAASFILELSEASQ